MDITPSGFPHSDIPGSTLACSSPRLIAACHVLHRRHVPRHPPLRTYLLDQNSHRGVSRAEALNLSDVKGTRFLPSPIQSLHQKAVTASYLYVDRHPDRTKSNQSGAIPKALLLSRPLFSNNMTWRQLNSCPWSSYRNRSFECSERVDF